MSIMVVGEYLTASDFEKGGPFRDGLGKLFKGFMREVGINPRECYFTNVMMCQPRGKQNVFSFCGGKEYGIADMRFFKKGHYVLAEYRPQIERLWAQINDRKPNLVLACGDLALWALSGGDNLKNSRGRIAPGNAAIPDRKVLPCFSARNVVQDWSQRPILLADLTKAKREAEFPDIRRPQRFIHLHPTIADLEDFYQQYIIPSPKLDVDIENTPEFITCVGFAPSPDRAIVVPFYDQSQSDGNYWRTVREEFLAWRWVARMLTAGKRVCGQNFQHDMQYLWRTAGIPCPDFADDTMLMHHALQPEMLKGLGFLGSVYTDELAWKFMHHAKAADKSTKKGDTE